MLKMTSVYLCFHYLHCYKLTLRFKRLLPNIRAKFKYTRTKKHFQNEQRSRDANTSFVLVCVIFVQYIANVTQRTFEIVQKIEITRIYLFNYIHNYVNVRRRRACESPVTSTCEVPNDV